jgi:hypothetical protein
MRLKIRCDRESCKIFGSSSDLNTAVAVVLDRLSRPCHARALQKVDLHRHSADTYEASNDVVHDPMQVASTSYKALVLA